MALIPHWGGLIADGAGMAVEPSADEYRKKADEMKSQAQRAETVYLQAIYASIADNWDRLAEQMKQAESAALNPPPPKKHSAPKAQNGVPICRVRSHSTRIFISPSMMRRVFRRWSKSSAGSG